MGTGIIIPRASAAPVVSPIHSAGVAGASHRYLSKLATYADTQAFPTLPDLVGAANLNADPGLWTSHVESSTVMARQGAGTDAANNAMRNSAIDLGATFSFVSVFRVPDASSTILTLDGFALTRAGNGNYTLGGGAGTAASTAGTQTNGWVVAIGVCQLPAPTLIVNSVAEVTGSGVTASSQTDRIYMGQHATTARTSPRDHVELTIWPFAFTTQQKADALAAMRSAYSFVPQT